MLNSMFVFRLAQVGVCMAILGVATSSLPACGDSGTGGAGGSGGTGSGGSGGSGMPVLINGCDSSMAIDKTDDAITTITFAGIEYTPRCVRIRAGSMIVFSGNFAAHPLVGGTVNGSTATPDPASVVPGTSSGSEVSFALSKAGAHPYYCSIRASSGMMGAIFVE
jgi:plastocyanin